jgi:hypothetical protein
VNQKQTLNGGETDESWISERDEIMAFHDLTREEANEVMRAGSSRDLDATRPASPRPLSTISEPEIEAALTGLSGR